MLSARTRALLRVVVIVVATTCVVTPVFNLFTDEFSWRSAQQGLVDAFLVSSAVGAYLLVVREGVARSWFRERAFASTLAINGTVLLLLFLGMRGLGQVVTSGKLADLSRSFTDAHLWFALPFAALLAFGFQFVVQMNRMIGPNVLRYFLTGTYHHPKDEARIFMFLDLADSTHLAERLGSGTYYGLLRRFVDDLSDPILESAGEIYQYAGDEVIVTWTWADGVRDANCVRCFFRIADQIERNAQRYERDFGARPRFRAGLHGGTVTGGELGDLRREIVFVGDVLNTTSRLEGYAKERGRELVVTGELVQALDLPDGIEIERLEEFVPRGKEQAIVAYAIGRSSGRSSMNARID